MYTACVFTKQSCTQFPNQEVKTLLTLQKSSYKPTLSCPAPFPCPNNNPITQVSSYSNTID